MGSNPAGEHGCLSPVSVVFCQVSATGRSLNDEAALARVGLLSQEKGVVEVVVVVVVVVVLVVVF